MSSQVALLACALFVAAALIVDSRRQPRVSSALWIPFLWLVVLASRPLTSWLNPFAPLALSNDIHEGSAVDRTIAIALMASATCILIARRLDWRLFFRENRWVTLFLLVCALSLLWSDFPTIAFKRLVRALGAMLMILVVVSDRNPTEAIATLIRRVTFVLIPVSFLLIKYYRDIGVHYDYWTGEQFLVGAGTDKNGLGRLCMLAGVFGVWDLMRTWRSQSLTDRWIHCALALSVLWIAVWLLFQAKSATALVTFVLGVFVLLSFELSLLRNNLRYLGLFIFAASAVALTAILSTSLLETIFSGLGRNMTLSTRTLVWGDLLRMPTNPIIGVGYDSFWLGDRLDFFVRKHNVNSAHNGLLEIYIELGAVGVMLLLGIVVSSYRKATDSLLQPKRFEFGKLQLAVLLVFLTYNLTESAYRPTSLMFFVLLLLTITLGRPTSNHSVGPTRQAKVRRFEAPSKSRESLA